MDINLTTLLSTGAILSVVGTAVYSLKELPTKAFRIFRSRFFFRVRLYQTDDILEMFESWLYEYHTQTYRDVEALAEKTDRWENADQRVSKRKIRFRQESATFHISYKGKLLWISKNKEKLDKSENVWNRFFSTYEITGWKAQEQIKALLEEVVLHWAKKRDDGTVKVFGSSPWGEWISMNDAVVKEIEKIFIEPELRKEIVNDLRLYISREQWYMERSIPYKRTYLFSGPPGNGKTSLALSLAGMVGCEVYSMSLGDLDGDVALRRCFSNLPKNALLLIEDIDKAFSMREAVGGHKVTFSSLINCLDGAMQKHGLLCVITTNHPEMLDPALLRAGRIDYKAEISNPSCEVVQEYVNKFYDSQTTEIQLWKNSLSMSTVQEICIRESGPGTALSKIIAENKTCAKNMKSGDATTEN